MPDPVIGAVDVAAFYRFAPLPDPAAARRAIASAACARGVRGTVLVAREGVNGTLAGARGDLEAVLDVVVGFVGAVRPRWSRAEAIPFGRLKVRLKREIVTLGVPVDTAEAGAYVAPEDWNAVLEDAGTVAVDVRNGYEVAIGSFEGAEDPETEAFGDFPAWWAANRDRLAGKRIAMFCTGGIRCEKSTALVRADGAEVVHLEGGILAYLDAVPEAESRWRGGCFVFDGRVALGHGLKPSGHGMCHACRRPLTPAQMAGPDYEAGVACPLCRDAFSEADRARFRERARQMALAEARGRAHLGREAAGEG